MGAARNSCGTGYLDTQRDRLVRRAQWGAFRAGHTQARGRSAAGEAAKTATAEDRATETAASETAGEETGTAADSNRSP